MRHPSLDNSYRVAGSRRPAGLAWLAVIALLSDALLPAALSIGIGLLGTGRDALALELCGASSGGQRPGKANPAALVHHCALCVAAPAALPPRQPSVAFPRTVSGEATPLLGGAEPLVPFRHCRAQPRAPPVAA